MSHLLQVGGITQTTANKTAEMLDEKTVYNYIDADLLSIDNIALPRKVRYRTRFHKKHVRVDKQCYVGRTYEDFETYLAANPDIRYTCGRNGFC